MCRGLIYQARTFREIRMINKEKGVDGCRDLIYQIHI